MQSTFLALQAFIKLRAITDVISTHFWKHSRALGLLPCLRYSLAWILYLSRFLIRISSKFMLVRNAYIKILKWNIVKTYSLLFISVTNFEGKGCPSKTRIGLMSYDSSISYNKPHTWSNLLFCYRNN